ncbi:MAG: cupredoxin domain-containing protein [Nanoarchaeota archaeon]
MKWLIGTAIVVVLVFFLGMSMTIAKAEIPGITGRAIINTGEVQEATLSFENYEYVMDPPTLKKGVPVKMTVDLDTVYGCMRDVVISSFGVRKFVSGGDNVIEFTPDKAGEFWVVCSMNMGRGKFTVAEPDGSKSAYVQQAPEESSCGSGGGG